MAVTEQYIISGTNVTLLSTELNGLGTSAVLQGTGAVAGMSGTASSNVQGDGKGNGYTLMNLELKLAAPGGSLAVNSAAYVWFLPNVTAQESGSGSTTGGTSATAVLPYRPPDAIIQLDSGSAAQTHTIKGVMAPASGSFLTLLAHNTGQTWGASGNTLTAQYYTRQGV